MKTARSTLDQADGTALVVREWAPDATPVRGVVVIAHGMAEHSGRYARLASALAATGFAVVAPDHRGHGETAGSPEKIGYLGDDGGWASVVADLRTLVHRARAEHPGVPVILLGHSMGSLLARTFALDHGDEIDGLVLSGTAGDPGPLGVIGLRIALAEKRFRGARHRSTLMDKLTFGAYNKPFAPGRTGFEWLSRDEAEVDAYVADPACGGVFTSGFYVDLLSAMPAINSDRRVGRMPKGLPVLLMSGDADPVGANGTGVRQVAARLRNVGMTDVSLRLYPGARHEIFNETNRSEVTSELLDWLDARYPAAG